jgi:hypothetical protein
VCDTVPRPHMSVTDHLTHYVAPRYYITITAHFDPLTARSLWYFWLTYTCTSTHYNYYACPFKVSESEGNTSWTWQRPEVMELSRDTIHDSNYPGTDSDYRLPGVICTLAILTLTHPSLSYGIT